jgi:hypothetical protein
MGSRAKSGSSALQTAFTGPKFRASVGDALNLENLFIIMERATPRQVSIRTEQFSSSVGCS